MPIFEFRAIQTSTCDCGAPFGTFDNFQKIVCPRCQQVFSNAQLLLEELVEDFCHERGFYEAHKKVTIIVE